MSADDVRRFGESLGGGGVKYGLSIEAGLTRGKVHGYPVRREPGFHPFNPRLTFDKPRDPSVVELPGSEPWILQHVLLSPVPGLDLARAGAFVAGLAGCGAGMSFGVRARRKQAYCSLGASATFLPVLTQRWLSHYPETAIVDRSDRAPLMDAGALALYYDLLSPAPYHRAVRASGSLWPAFFRLCDDLGDDDILDFEVAFVPTIHAWQENIAGILQSEKFLGQRAPHGQTAAAKHPDEPFFAVSIRIGTTNPALASGVEALIGMVTSDGRPFQYRTKKDFLRAISDADFACMLRDRITFAPGQLLTSSELALFVHPPDPRTAGNVRLEVKTGLPVPERLQKNGIPLGVNTGHGVPIPVFYPVHEQYNTHLSIVGTGGKGKSAALIHWIRYLATRGAGL